MLGMGKEVSQMSKKLIAACMALTAFVAFAVAPSLASAKPVVTHPTGTVLATGKNIKATNVGETIMETPIGTLRCTSATMTGTLTTNSTAAGFEGDITSASFSGTGSTVSGEPLPECTGAFGNASITPTVSAAAPWCLEGTEANDNFKLRGGSCLAASKALEFQIVVTIFGAPVNCKYERAAAVTGTFVTHPSDAVLSVSKQNFPIAAGQSGFCPGNGELTMSFTTETDTAVAEPLYISS
jgi:hypothetical protein